LRHYFSIIIFFISGISECNQLGTEDSSCFNDNEGSFSCDCLRENNENEGSEVRVNSCNSKYFYIKRTLKHTLYLK